MKKETTKKTQTRKKAEMKAPLFSQEGKEVGSVALPEKVFGVSWNPDLVHQVVTSMQANARTGAAHTKTRGEVRGGGKKPWRQKGTGRARHGSIRSPLWPGGGVTHGPRNDKVYSRKINQKMRAKALFSVLSKKLQDGEILFVDALSISEPKTKEAKNILTKLSGIKGFETIFSKKKNAALLAVNETSLALRKSFNNFGNVEFDELRNLNPVKALQYKNVVIVGRDGALETLAARLK